MFRQTQGQKCFGLIGGGGSTDDAQQDIRQTDCSSDSSKSNSNQNIAIGTSIAFDQNDDDLDVIQDDDFEPSLIIDGDDSDNEVETQESINTSEDEHNLFENVFEEDIQPDELFLNLITEKISK